MSEDKGPLRPSPDPLELWRRWYETSVQDWTSLLRDGKGVYADPFGLYRQWLESLKETGQSAEASTTGVTNIYDLWRWWADATAESWRRAAGLTPLFTDAAPRWAEMVEKSWEQMLEKDGPPVDPVDLSQRWYKAVNGPLTEMATDVLENESLLEYSRQAFRTYALFDRLFRRFSEEYFGWLQLSTSSDATRIAGLVAALDERVDRLEEALEDSDYGREGLATGDAVASLDQRLRRVEGRLEQLDRVEEKLDRLLKVSEASNGSEEEVRATDAARRKAEELDVNLSQVEGTGANGQITVDDVREKGRG
ncbi:MAG: E3 binding domain-containing protein [Actinomycetota bacterium]|nr:E3 binding domain-containing protein [Actinomycetota bacterium]